MVRLDGLLHWSLKWYLSIAIVMIVITIVWIAVENLIHQIIHITNDGTFIKTIQKMLNSKNIRITLFVFYPFLLYLWGSLFSHLIKVRMLHTLFSCQAYVVIVLHHFSQQVQRIRSRQMLVVLINECWQFDSTMLAKHTLQSYFQPNVVLVQVCIQLFSP